MTLGLRAKLVLLLLGFGVVPLALTITVGYVVSRSLITERSKADLKEVTELQAGYLATELRRQRLLLRTIAGQLPSPPALALADVSVLSRLLVQSLPEGGVFDGLRVVSETGTVEASVALGNTAPRWPPHAPAADWSRRPVVVHRSGSAVLAYLLAMRVSGHHGAFAWLEGHVRAEDFRRLFAMPEHLIGGAELALLERTGATVFAAHDHGSAGLAELPTDALGDSTVMIRASVGGAPSLVAMANVQGTDWILATYLPLDLALAPLARLRNSAVFSSALLVAIVILTGVVAAGSVTTPLRELAIVVRQVGRGGDFAPVPHHSGDEVGQLIASFNRMTEDLARSREEIESLHQRELERAQQLATVGELASGVAHEIRNPLMGVLGALELALRKIPPGDESRPLLEEAQTQLRRIETTTTQLLRYARPQEPREVVVDANLVVDRAVRLIEGQATSAGVTVRTDAAGDAVLVRVDPELMVQVLVNLMLNAVEAMQSGGDLVVWISRHAPEVWIGVRDTGPGVPPDRRADIFRPFFTTKNQGTGLGLSISHQIVLRHGGSLRVEDAPGGGATFVVALPLVTTGGGSGA